MLSTRLRNQNFINSFTQEDYKYFNTNRDKFLLDIKDKSKKLEFEIGLIVTNKDISEEKLNKCKVITHGFKGIGYSFGFKFISEVGFCMDEMLNDLLNKRKYIQNKYSYTNKDYLIFNISKEFNDLLSDVITRYFLKNKKFIPPNEYYDRLHSLLNKADLVYSKKNY